MKNLLEQIGSMAGAGVAAACCLGVPLVLSTLGAVGLSFLIQDAYLLPIFTAFIALTLWLQYRAAKRYEHIAPFWLGLVSGVVAIISLGLLVTGIYAASWLIYLATGAVVAASIWGFIDGVVARREGQVCADPETVDIKRRAINGSVIAAAAGGLFFAMYKTVDIIVPAAQAGEIACYGINTCKGLSSCTTASNACMGQNECKGLGLVNIAEKQCYTKGGVPLKGSPADPANG